MKEPNPTQVKLPVFDLQTLISDFRTLDPKDPGLWPPLPRAIILAGILFLALLAGWWFGWRMEFEELDAKVQQETTLKKEWKTKKTQAVNLDEYRNRLTEINRAFGALLKQLPDSSEMESLLVDINQAGLGRGLQFELFKPDVEQLRDFYAELPITIRVTGSYHDLGAFAGDVAKLPRIVTLNNIDVTAGKDGGILAMSAVAKTFRYLDEAEVARQRKEKSEKSVKTKGGGK
jgi:type IV pilus assembly protein PilO